MLMVGMGVGWGWGWWASMPPPPVVTRDKGVWEGRPGSIGRSILVGSSGGAGVRRSGKRGSSLSLRGRLGRLRNHPVPLLSIQPLDAAAT